MWRPRPRHTYRLVTDRRARDRWRRERWLDAAAHLGVHSIGIQDGRGHRYFIDPRDRVIGRLLWLDGTYEHETLDRALDLIGFTPDQIVDIGANIGTVTVELLTRFPSATAIAFEPDARNYVLLEQNLVINDLRGRTQIVPLALSDVDGFVELETSTDNFGDHRVRLSESAGDLGEELRATRMIRSRRLDTLIRECEVALSDRAIVSLDVQGHEAHILDGGAALLRYPIIVEFWPYGLRRAGGYDRFLAAIEGRRIVELVESPRDVNVQVLRRMEPGMGLTDLLLLPR